MVEYLFIGKFGKTVGLKGFLKVNIDLKDKNILENLSSVFTKDENNYKELFIEDIRSDKPDIIKISGIDDVNQADSLRDLEVFARKDEIEKIDNFYLYSNEIINAEVYEKNIKRGIITKYDNFGASDIIEILLDNGEKILIPIIDSIIKEIDIKEKKVYVENIDDYI
jgi:16S rRNA processing protein RimM